LELEPHAAGISALRAAEGASFDAGGFVRALATEFVREGGQIALDEELVSCEESSLGLDLYTSKRRLRAGVMINAGGLEADRIAHQLGVGLNYQIIPFRGQYHQLVQHRRGLVNSHIYATPDLNFPFLGVHFSRTYDGAVTIGPGAVLALGRQAYETDGFDWRDVSQMLKFAGFWRMFADDQFRQLAAREWQKSLFVKAVFEEARKLIPKLTADDLITYRAGIRAQLVNNAGQLIDDLVIERTAASIHVLNAVSPALTCSLPFAENLLASVLGDSDQARKSGTALLD
jgi:(S)-2-hydroxyglutarate dehydrogenase